MKILLGFEVGTGKKVEMTLHHTIVTGQTGISGKTTCIQGLISRSGLKAITFRTKRGEIGFETANKVPLFFNDRGLTEWKTLEGLIEATLMEKTRFEPGLREQIISVTKQAATLDDVYQNVVAKLAEPKMRGFVAGVLTKLQAYLDMVMPQIRKLVYTRTLKLENGANVMDLEGLTDEMQFLVMHSVMMEIITNGSDTIIVVPEAWKSLSQDHGTPVKNVAERIIREGRSVGVWLWPDSQDLRGIDKKYLRGMDNWILGRQKDPHEVESNLKAIPLARKDKPKVEEIQKLGLGQFFACLHDDVIKAYALPEWLPEAYGYEVATGARKVEDVVDMMPANLKLVQSLKKEQREKEEVGVPLERPSKPHQENRAAASREVTRLNEREPTAVGNDNGALEHAHTAPPSEVHVVVELPQVLVQVSKGAGLTFDDDHKAHIIWALHEMDKLVVPNMVSKFCEEHGIPLPANRLSENAKELVEIGLILKDKAGRYRLPSEVKFTVDVK